MIPATSKLLSGDLTDLLFGVGTVRKINKDGGKTALAELPGVLTGSNLSESKGLNFFSVFPDGLPHLLLLGDPLREVSQEGREIRRGTERTGSIDQSRLACNSCYDCKVILLQAQSKKEIVPCIATILNFSYVLVVIGRHPINSVY